MRNILLVVLFLPLTLFRDDISEEDSANWLIDLTICLGRCSHSSVYAGLCKAVIHDA